MNTNSEVGVFELSADNWVSIARSFERHSAPIGWVLVAWQHVTTARDRERTDVVEHDTIPRISLRPEGA